MQVSIVALGCAAACAATPSVAPLDEVLVTAAKMDERDPQTIPMFYTPFNDPIQRKDPYALLGVRVEYGSSDRRWALAAYGRNLTNRDYVTATFGTAATAFGGRPGPSRQFAIEFTANVERP